MWLIIGAFSRTISFEEKTCAAELGLPLLVKFDTATLRAGACTINKKQTFLYFEQSVTVVQLSSRNLIAFIGSSRC